MKPARGIELSVFDERRAQVFGADHLFAGRDPMRWGRVVDGLAAWESKTAKRPARPPGLLSPTFRKGKPVRPVDHFAAFCESLTQSDDRWEGQPLKPEAWQRRFWREALDDWRFLACLANPTA